jgi:hypothetical protein
MPFSTATLDDDSSESDQTTTFVIQLDDGTTVECDFSELAPHTSNLPSDQITSDSPSDPSDPFGSMPYILKRNSKITFDHQGAFHKGYLDHTFEGVLYLQQNELPMPKRHFGASLSPTSSANGIPWSPKT